MNRDEGDLPHAVALVDLPGVPDAETTARLRLVGVARGTVQTLTRGFAIDELRDTLEDVPE